ncbi:MAG: hypothetical protein HY047_15245 [Acidobacteria bacterium]|nr:hypothetical protein [Acidobacteriota bacterium]
MVRALSADARPAYLSRTCEGDDALRQQVEQLLASHERAKSFLETPAALRLDEITRTTQLDGRRSSSLRLEPFEPHDIAVALTNGGEDIFATAHAPAAAAATPSTWLS